MGSVKVVIKNRTKLNGRSPVCIRITHGRRSAYEIMCYANKGHFRNGKVLVYEPLHSEMNRRIAERLEQLNEIIGVYEQRDWAYTSKDILSLDYDKFKEREANKPILSLDVIQSNYVLYAENVIRLIERRGDIRLSVRYQQEIDVFKLYLSTIHRTDVDMLEITSRFLTGYFAWCRHDKGKLINKQGNSYKPDAKDSTIARRLKYIKAILNRAHDEGLINAIPISKSFHIKSTSSKKITLSPGQIQQMETTDWNNIKKERGRPSKCQLAADTWLCQYYLWGARVGDVMALKNRNVIARDGEPIRVKYTQMKGGSHMEIYLSESMRSIVKRYWKPDKPDAFLLPWLEYEYDPLLNADENKFQLQTDITTRTSSMNHSLGIIGRHLKIAGGLSTHVARHTFARQAKLKGKGIDFIRQCLGHKSYTVTQVYLGELDSDEINDEMEDIYA